MTRPHLASYRAAHADIIEARMSLAPANDLHCPDCHRPCRDAAHLERHVREQHGASMKPTWPDNVSTLTQHGSPFDTLPADVEPSPRHYGSER